MTDQKMETTETKPEVKATEEKSAAVTKEKSPEEKKAEKTKPVAKKGKKNKAKRRVDSGRVYIQATYNNTVVTVADQHGNALAQCSAGQVGFRGPKKSTPYAAGIIVKNVIEKVQGHGLREASVFVKGVGSGREASIRALNANGINVISIKDVTPIPHNGPRARKPRRV